MNVCTCRNQHKPLDGCIYTDPGCRQHGESVYNPSPAEVEASRLQDIREDEAIRRSLLCGRKKKKPARMYSPRLPVGRGI